MEANQKVDFFTISFGPVAYYLIIERGLVILIEIQDQKTSLRTHILAHVASVKVIMSAKRALRAWLIFVSLSLSLSLSLSHNLL